ncbi:DUF1617 family protein [Marinilactibacillus psychrotolerans]|uniref:DUF1617 family protein n=1 Tax=Marinilactibacillus psychrotolerans TaxID=191770 RepID=UPI0039B00392
MKNINLKNKDIVLFYNVLDNLIVEGYKPKRGKGRLQKSLKEKEIEYVDDLNNIRNDYFEKTEDGKYKQDQKGNIVWLDKYKNDKDAKEKANEQIKELLDDDVVIPLVEHESKIRSFYDAILKDEFTSKNELRDEDFETLIEALEEVFENNKEDK